MLTSLFRNCLVALLLLGLSSALQAVSLKPDAPKRYEVQRGDSLWSISEMYIDDPWMWPQLWQANPNIENPHLIYPGDIIHLLDFEGLAPSLRLEPRLRVMTQQEPIPFLPLDTIDAFLNRDLITDPRTFEEALYIVDINNGRTMGASGDRIQALGAEPAEVEFYSVYRDLEPVRDPITRRVLGHRAQALGVARLVSAENGQPAVLQLANTFQEVRVGDRLIPFTGLPFDAMYRPSSPDPAVHGLLVMSLNGDRNQIGQYQPVLLNLGADQVQPGHLLEVMEPGRRLRNPSTGEVVFAAENVRGMVMVYRTFDNASLGLVLRASESLKPNDVVRAAR